MVLRKIDEMLVKAKQQWPAANHEGQLFLKGYQMALEELKQETGNKEDSLEFREKEIKPVKDKLKGHKDVLAAFEHTINLYRKGEYHEAGNLAIAIGEYLEEQQSFGA